MPVGLIIKGVGGIYSVKNEKNLYECSARGVFRKKDITPLPGDRVEFDILSDETKEGVINNILDRKNQLVRPAVANIDQMALFIAVKSPDPDLYLVDKMLLSAIINNIDVILCINKCDLDEDNYSDVLKNMYLKSNVKIITLSAKNNTGIDELAGALKNKITVLAGQSGAGKSTTLNRIFGTEIMQTGDVSKKTERGRHTTRHAELFGIEQGFIVDSPGFSSFEIDNIEPADLQIYYPEFKEYLGECRFKECVHLKEPDCAVKEAVKSGTISDGRYGRYTEFAGVLNERKLNKYKNKK